MADRLAIETVDLHKTYGGVEALRGLNLEVPAGTIFGFLGQNGAGKTTAIKILLGMARPTGGSARVFGFDAAAQPSSVAIRARTGFVSEDKDLLGHLSVDQTIRFTSAFYPRWRRDQEQHFRSRFAPLVAAVAGGETTVFFSSHQIAEVDQIADRIAIVDRGRIAVSGGLDDLRASCRRIQIVFDDAAPEPAFRSPGLVRVVRNHRVLSVVVSGGAEGLIDEARSMRPVAIDSEPLTLKEMFLETVAKGE